MDSRVSGRPPLVILCQHQGGSCAACCGVDNFVDRSPDVTRARLQRRTELVTRAWPDPQALAQARDALLELERADVLFAGVKVCPFAGFVDDDRVGCLIHPTRHPQGEDLRDLAVYPKEVCAGHFCAPHDWLRPVEVAAAQCARGIVYGRVVTDAGLVKAVCKAVSEIVGRSLVARDVDCAADAFAAFWDELLVRWAWRDPDPRRFGGFAFAGDDAVERTLPSCLAGLEQNASAAERVILDAVGTKSLDQDDAGAALSALRDGLARVADAVAA